MSIVSSISKTVSSMSRTKHMLLDNRWRTNKLLFPAANCSITSYISSFSYLSISRYSSSCSFKTNNIIRNNGRVKSSRLVALFDQSSFFSSSYSSSKERFTDISATTTSTVKDDDIEESSSHAIFCANDIIQMLPKLPSSHWKRIYLIRHGETDWNTEGKLQGGGYDLELNDNGINQAHQAANLIQKIQYIIQSQQNHLHQDSVDCIQLIVSSHLKRSSQTADIIYQKLIQPIPDDKSIPKIATKTTKSIQRATLNEFGEMRFGQYEGLMTIPSSTNTELDSFKVHNIMMLSDPTLRWPGNGGESIQDVMDRISKGLKLIYQQHPTVSCLCIVGHGKVSKILLQHLVSSLSTNDSIEQGNACINVLDYNALTNDYIGQIINYMDHIPTGHVSLHI